MSSTARRIVKLQRPGGTDFVQVSLRDELDFETLAKRAEEYNAQPVFSYEDQSGDVLVISNATELRDVFEMIEADKRPKLKFHHSAIAPVATPEPASDVDGSESKADLDVASSAKPGSPFFKIKGHPPAQMYFMLLKKVTMSILEKYECSMSLEEKGFFKWQITGAPEQKEKAYEMLVRHWERKVEEKSTLISSTLAQLIKHSKDGKSWSRDVTKKYNAMVYIGQDCDDSKSILSDSNSEMVPLRVFFESNSDVDFDIDELVSTIKVYEKVYVMSKKESKNIILDFLKDKKEFVVSWTKYPKEKFGEWKFTTFQKALYTQVVKQVGAKFVTRSKQLELGVYEYLDNAGTIKQWLAKAEKKHIDLRFSEPSDEEDRLSFSTNGNGGRGRGGRGGRGRGSRGDRGGSIRGDRGGSIRGDRGGSSRGGRAESDANDGKGDAEESDSTQVQAGRGRGNARGRGGRRGNERGREHGGRGRGHGGRVPDNTEAGRDEADGQRPKIVRQTMSAHGPLEQVQSLWDQIVASCEELQVVEFEIECDFGAYIAVNEEENKFRTMNDIFVVGKYGHKGGIGSYSAVCVGVDIAQLESYETFLRQAIKNLQVKKLVDLPEDRYAELLQYYFERNLVSKFSKQHRAGVHVDRKDKTFSIYCAPDLDMGSIESAFFEGVDKTKKKESLFTIKPETWSVLCSEKSSTGKILDACKSKKAQLNPPLSFDNRAASEIKLVAPVKYFDAVEKELQDLIQEFEALCETRFVKIGNFLASELIARSAKIQTACCAHIFVDEKDESKSISQFVKKSNTRKSFMPTRAPDQRFQWQWKEEAYKVPHIPDAFVCYDYDQNGQIEAAFQAGSSEVIILGDLLGVKRGASYKVDFKTMKQKNMQTGWEREIRRRDDLVCKPLQAIVGNTVDLKDEASGQAEIKVDSQAVHADFGNALVSCYIYGQPQNCLKAVEEVRSLVVDEVLDFSVAVEEEDIEKLKSHITSNVVLQSIPDSSLRVVCLKKFWNGVKQTIRIFIEGKGAQSMLSAKPPREWTPQTVNFTMVELEEKSEELRKVVKRVQETMPNAVVLKVERIQNLHLWSKYMVEKKHLAAKYGEFKDDEMEGEWFHGTKSLNPADIYEGEIGFDMKFGNEFCMWGRALYFAWNASYSYSYGYKENGRTVILLNRVLRGKSINLNPGKLVSPPCLPQDEVDKLHTKFKNPRYDSVEGYTGGSNVLMVYENQRAYPLYRIELS
eukprot:TRINITY_DN32_c0_g1_i1.p1 TRINITY_DN32_c0_g1~~TRINITY_DN32_c0_g1_i1.p1  ORF type:complete len:1229 (-),score=349.68 TRINITY_DN32_c0_g1_i1:93-3779(-)